MLKVVKEANDIVTLARNHRTLKLIFLALYRLYIKKKSCIKV